MGAHDLVPHDDDLPGTGWLAIDEGFEAPGGGGPGEMIDCVGPEFPDAAVVVSVSSPHFVRPPGRLVHGIAVEFDGPDAAQTAAGILSSARFAECLGGSVAADIHAGTESGALDTELLAVDVAATDTGHRVSFAGGGERGVLPVHLDIAIVHEAAAVGVLWCGDTPEPFPLRDLAHLVGRLRRR